MCGIIGIINKKANELLTESVLDTLVKRGPDDFGVFFDDNIAMGHTRLAIQDLSAKGHQPMISNDGQYVIIFNGEIYNHSEVRAILTAKGSEFSSHSDTETLLYGYIHFGEKIVQMLNGIFAFAIFDKKKKELFIARDKIGVKPLYYYYSKDSFVFSSQIKTIQKIEKLNNEADENAMLQSIMLLWLVDDKTGIKNIKKLLPGHYIKIKVAEEKELNISKWASEPFKDEYSLQNEQELITELDTILTASVQRQLLSDKPIGYFLSGGLDSSLLLAIAHKIDSKKATQAFTISAGKAFTEEGFSDDLYYAKAVAEHLKIDLEIIEANPNLIEQIDEMIFDLEEPQTDFAPLFVKAIAHNAKAKGFDVLFSGTGADDIFSGYRRHVAIMHEKKIEKIPNFLRKIINVSAPYLPENKHSRRIKKIAESIDKNSFERMASYFFWTDKTIAFSLFTSAIQSKIEEDTIENNFGKLLKSIPQELHPLNKLLHLEMNSFLPNHNLNYTDKMGMAASVEIRVPYLDNELVAFAAKLPPTMKIKGTTTKYLLRKVAEKYLPKEVIYRPKTGFGAPIRTWMKTNKDFQKTIWEKLHLPFFMSNSVFELSKIEQLYNETITQKKDHSYTLLSLVCIESWVRQFDVDITSLTK